jgi:hypothetical protein
MTPIDEAYKMTKLVKQGKKTLSQDFVELANFIGTTYNVKVLNIICDSIDNGARPRLFLILEFEQDAKMLNSKFGFSEIPNAEKEILAKEFIEKVAVTLPQFENNRAFIVILSFEDPAKIEANWSISKEEVQTFQSGLNIKELWQVRPDIFSTASFFLYTNYQVQRFLENGMKEYLTEKYFELIKKHDEFGYYNKNSFSIELESKENFESNWEGNWFFYDRR